jgi:hypothetical protein
VVVVVGVCWWVFWVVCLNWFVVVRVGLFEGWCVLGLLWLLGCVSVWGCGFGIVLAVLWVGVLVGVVVWSE